MSGLLCKRHIISYKSHDRSEMASGRKQTRMVRMQPQRSRFPAETQHPSGSESMGLMFKIFFSPMPGLGAVCTVKLYSPGVGIKAGVKTFHPTIGATSEKE